MALADLTYSDVLQLIANYYNTDVATIEATFAQYNIPVTDVEQTFKMLDGTGYSALYNSDGTVRSYLKYGTKYSSGGTAGSVASSIDSNVAAAVAEATKTGLDIPLETKANATTSLAEVTGGVTKTTSGVATKVTSVLSSVGTAVAGVATGIQLGKTIDSLLYNANPDYWDARGMSSLDPDTWNFVTGEDDLGGTIMNAIFGINNTDKTSQMYLDENAVAYLAYYMQTTGMFSSSSRHTIDSGQTVDGTTITGNLYKVSSTFSSKSYAFTGTLATDLLFKWMGYNNALWSSDSAASSSTIYVMSLSDTIIVAGDNSKVFSNQTVLVNDAGERSGQGSLSNVYTYTYNNKTVKYALITEGTPIYPVSTPSISDTAKLAWLTVFGTSEAEGVLPGTGNQEGATLPDLSTAESPEDVLDLLKDQYPDWFDEELTEDVIQPDGTTITYKYLPVGTPEATSNTDTKPTTGEQTQDDTEIDPDTSTETLIQLVQDLISRTPTPTDTNTDTDTGTGSSPSVTVPTGSASALYKIYNPTQAQLDSFGAWLWSSAFVDQLLKLFNDPMQAIIGLHKVYCPVTAAGTQNIKVGYLDSGVSSNYINSQYVTVSCGSVSLAEKFGNVFDYDPFTKVYIYLPFIGIEQLSVGDVMRSTITVTYRCDVLTGACLAEIRVTRDGCCGILYTYAGNCAVQYPVSSGSYMGIVESMAGIGAGIIGTVATGGALAPLALGAVGSLMSAHTNVSHSGAFSGNAGAMGVKTPYLIITRPQTEMAATFPALEGYPANYSTTIGNCSGYVEVAAVHVENIPATDMELTEIETLLKQGVII